MSTRYNVKNIRSITYGLHFFLLCFNCFNIIIKAQLLFLWWAISLKSQRPILSDIWLSMSYPKDMEVFTRLESVQLTQVTLKSILCSFVEKENCCNIQWVILVLYYLIFRHLMISVILASLKACKAILNNDAALGRDLSGLIKDRSLGQNIGNECIKK